MQRNGVSARLLGPIENREHPLPVILFKQKETWLGIFRKVAHQIDWSGCMSELRHVEQIGITHQ